MARKTTSVSDAVAALRSKGSEANRQGMKRFGINVDRAFGVSVVEIKKVAREIAHDHALAEALWQTGLHEARILAGFVDRPQWVSEAQMDRWTGEFDSWDLCDQICGNLWDRTPHAGAKIRQWAADEREFVRRAAFATLAWMAVHDKKADDESFLSYLPLIRAGATDSRNFVRKAVNWALRQIGKRSPELHGPCLDLARELSESEDRTARWTGKDAQRELESPKLQEKLGL
jgi:3-methyladenine DNA glycosylase AlkD